MAAITRSRTVPAEQQAVWDVLADFGELSSWVDRCDHSSILNHGLESPAGTSRRVQMGRDVLVETITEFVAPITLAYDIDGLSARFGRLANRWTLSTTGPDTVVSVTSTIDCGRGARARATELVVGRVMAKTSDEMLAGLIRRMESRHD
ncbi:SRPBCC family protein [Mycolicibacterium arenosum]|uniref:SRPBCC family protein n=1 Tax=Mycolicibacterium arenosum TaxID=2952157 RepID=A0ABT1MDL5_9MYCO|nr:SRPBCC family protein [Mycolicibacterium sp. CAU 1645]MCP9276269.1 SRPBCC family protein [Mycolicibacterium sp. CAU 1645]